MLPSGSANMYQYKAENWIKSEENISINKYTVYKHEEIEAHTHDFLEIVYIWSGSGCHIINGATYPVERGDLLFFNYGDYHLFHTSAEMGMINCLIKPEFIGNELVESENALDILALSAFKDFTGLIDSILPKVKFLGRDLMEVEALFESMQYEFEQKALGYRAVLKSYLNVLLTKLFRVIKKSDVNDFYGDIGKVTPEILEFIEANYNKKLTLKELAKYSFYNPAYFSRIFKECYGKTLTEYITEKRMIEALRMIGETDLSIENICYLVGYKDRKQFYKLFKSYTGLTPSKYRTVNFPSHK